MKCVCMNDYLGCEIRLEDDTCMAGCRLFRKRIAELEDACRDSSRRLHAIATILNGDPSQQDIYAAYCQAYPGGVDAVLQTTVDSDAADRKKS